MKKSELRQIIKEEIKRVLKEEETTMINFDLKKYLAENKLLKENVEEVDRFIEGLQNTIKTANQLKMDGPSENMDFGSLIDATRDFLREF